MSTAMKAPSDWLIRAIRVVLVGAGGNGSEALDVLSQFDTGLRALGHPHGLDVTVFDEATVRESNIVRQRFWPCDIGTNKAISLVNRYNHMLGLNWEAVPFSFERQNLIDLTPDILITAVDLASVRVMVADTQLRRPIIWLDIGNSVSHGQAVLGRLGGSNTSKLLNVLEHYPSIREMKDNTQKSCSTAESIARQNLLVNRQITTAAMSLLWDLLRDGECKTNVLCLDLKTKLMNAIAFG